ncbi:putative 2-hydroxyacyl-CoA lyase [[Candida] railenensis]|uniref:2-hydroxyacyl-CoA lyase n=1 Tax=[Candida] railenensis TaxID=45579 RepID=A0A9P0W0W1_9ASCO|nr:putative 2-hydroxyacyl-CoA lyase [[Candida] railenensis]
MVAGSDVIAQTLVELEIDTVFGIVGIPVVQVADALIAKGIKFIAFRNEQAASYAASIYGFLTKKPGVLLVVGGPGVVHATAGILNANSNCWPLLVLAGSASFDENQKGGFQELDQVSYLAGQTKFAARPFDISQVPRLIEKAYRVSYFGKPGTTYIDLPANLIQTQNATDLSKSIEPPRDAPRSQADPAKIAIAAKILSSAKNPLVIIGKGAAYADASESISELVNKYKLPFLPTPMGKGVVPDSHELNFSSSRSLAISSADVIVLCGARLNWILHSGERFLDDAKIITIDNHAEEIGNNRSISTKYGLYGDLDLVVRQLSSELHALNYTPPPIYQELIVKRKINTQKAEAIDAKPTPAGALLSYHRVYKIIRDALIDSSVEEKGITYVSEGANTMDISRTSFPLNYPRKRLDAGTNATMGVGLPYAIAAKVANPNELVVALEGDSAIGFTGMELETIARNDLAMIIVVLNNSGIYHGSDPKLYEVGSNTPLPSTALSQNTRYDLVAQGLGINGALVHNEEELEKAIKDAISAYQLENKSTLINVKIDLGLNTTLSFGWQNNKKKSKL